jgi:hypothetical protein
MERVTNTCRQSIQDYIHKVASSPAISSNSICFPCFFQLPTAVVWSLSACTQCVYTQSSPTEDLVLLCVRLEASPQVRSRHHDSLSHINTSLCFQNKREQLKTKIRNIETFHSTETHNLYEPRLRRHPLTLWDTR